MKTFQCQRPGSFALVEAFDFSSTLIFFAIYMILKFQYPIWHLFVFSSLIQKRSVEGGKQGNSIKKLKKEKIVGTTGKSARSETNSITMAPRVKPELTLPVM